MPYCQPADVARYAPQSSAHEDLVEDLIAEAQVVVDSVLRQVYLVPFAAPVDPMIQQLTAKLAAGRWLRASASQVGNDGLIDHGRRLEDEVMAELRDIVANPRRLAVAQLAPAQAHSGVKVGGGTPVFDMGDPVNWGEQ